MDSLFCYSQRLLNPFRGSVNVIRYQSAEAVTTDGINWDIYVRNEELLDDLDSHEQIQISDVRYGKWSEKKGLTRGPIYPSADFRRMEKVAQIVYEHLIKVHTEIPFPYADKFELWLLDKQNRPLALLNSAALTDSMNEHQILDWRAGQLCKKLFTLTESANFPDNPGDPKNPAEYLTKYINSLSNEIPVVQWFERKNTIAKGLSGINLPDNLRDRELNNSLFPKMMLNTTRHDTDHAYLVNEFIKWQAPWLLVLDTITLAQRKEYEILARNQALLVEQYYRLYPEIINEMEINAARVEAMMRKSQPQVQDEEEVLSTFYLELSPSPTE